MSKSEPVHRIDKVDLRGTCMDSPGMCEEVSLHTREGAREVSTALPAFAQVLLDWVWWLYRVTLSPLFGPACRFAPSCSLYGREAVRRYGLARGGWMAVKRILRCHPFHPGGWDPVV